MAYSGLLLLTILALVVALSSAFKGRIATRFTIPVVFAGTVPLVANGKRYEAPEGSSLNAACQKLGLKVPFKCKKGECATCTVTIGGLKYKPCVAKVPPVPMLKSILEKALTVTVDNA